MSYPPDGYPAYGPDPWHQTSWDIRAAGNFICGGAGSGLIVFATIADGSAAALPALTLVGLALVALGLFSVSLELGRPFRALNVIRNPWKSWMAREAWTAALLFAAGIVVAWGVPDMSIVAAVLAVVFVYCQGRLLQAAKGIPAWRERRLVPLIVTTGLAEGAGLFFVTSTWHDAGTLELLNSLGALVLARVLVWLWYRRRLADAASRAALAALDRAGRVLQVAGTVVPLIVIAAIGLGIVAGEATEWAAAIAGLFTVGAGAYLKYTLITGAGFNQGFALAHLPVRGARR
jgi:phenylacetyl-CoA:acceptor oxidoreductase 26-kDa subunit